MLLNNNFSIQGRFQVEIRRKNGCIETIDFPNIVTDEGRVYLLKSGISNEATAITNWYIGLIGANYTPSATDVAATALGGTGFYSEITTAYTETTRPSYTAAYTTTPVKRISNISSPASFTFANAATVYGAFLVSNNVKGGTNGILFSAGLFTASKTMSVDDIIAIRYFIDL